MKHPRNCQSDRHWMGVGQKKAFPCSPTASSQDIMQGCQVLKNDKLCFKERKNFGFYYINFYRLRKANYLLNYKIYFGVNRFIKRPNLLFLAFNVPGNPAALCLSMIIYQKCLSESAIDKQQINNFFCATKNSSNVHN